MNSQMLPGKSRVHGNGCARVACSRHLEFRASTERFDYPKLCSNTTISVSRGDAVVAERKEQAASFQQAFGATRVSFSDFFLSCFSQASLFSAITASPRETLMPVYQASLRNAAVCQARKAALHQVHEAEESAKFSRMTGRTA